MEAASAPTIQSPARHLEQAHRQAFFGELFPTAPIVRTTGLRLEFAPDGAAICRLKHNPALDHGQGGIFGGILSSMLDLSGWFTVAQHYDSWLVTIEYTTRILEEQRGVDLWSRGIARKLGRTTAFADMEVYTADDQLVAIGSGTFRVTTRKMTHMYR